MEEFRLTAAQLYTECDADVFQFNYSSELKPFAEIIGQDRALDALRFGVGIQQDGYNLYAQGPAGLGKHSIVRQIVDEYAGKGAVPDEWCYVNNFRDAHNPVAISLPAGMGMQFKHDMSQLVDELKSAIPSLFESEQYHARAQEINEEYSERREQALLQLTEDAEKHNITLIRTPTGFAFAPLVDGKVISPEEYEKLPEEESARIEEIVEVFEEKLGVIIRQEPLWKKEARNKLKRLNNEVTGLTVSHLVNELKEKYRDHAAVMEYLGFVQGDVIENARDFISQEEVPYSGVGEGDPASFRIYQVNLLTDHQDAVGAPVIYEDAPTYEGLIGRVEHLAQMGALITDFTMIKGGALHRANGGYLILDIHKVLTQPYAWEGLKRALFSREIHIKSLGQIYSLVSTVSLDPQPIPLDVKVVLIGDRMLNYLLCAYDDEFGELFKVAVDFEEQVDRSDENNQLYARLIGTVACRHNLLPLDRGGVARVIEYCSRLSSDSEKLSTHMMNLSDLIKEADYWAREDGQKSVDRECVQKAIDKQRRRHGRIQENMYEHIRRKTILIDTSGEVLGQVNGLSVVDIGGYSFGQPARITATARIGDGELVDIEREVELGGAIHSKGVLILSSFIASRYSHDIPLSLSASLVFEQSYGGVEGDSATIAECCALLSALSGCPIKQSLAVTGSMNQHGYAQAIGGVNDKIEGFFEVCSQEGLTGEQGVIIPQSNVSNLMLSGDVVQAVKDGRFHVYAVSTVDEAVSLLTGVAAGVVDAEGAYPEHTLNYRVNMKLREYADYREEHSKPSKG